MSFSLLAPSGRRNLSTCSFICPSPPRLSSVCTPRQSSSSTWLTSSSSSSSSLSCLLSSSPWTSILTWHFTSTSLLLAATWPLRLPTSGLWVSVAGEDKVEADSMLTGEMSLLLLLWLTEVAEVAIVDGLTGICHGGSFGAEGEDGNCRLQSKNKFWALTFVRWLQLHKHYSGFCTWLFHEIKRLFCPKWHQLSSPLGAYCEFKHYRERTHPF